LLKKTDINNVIVEKNKSNIIEKSRFHLLCTN